MALKFRRGTTAQKSGSLAYGEPYVNTTLGTLQIGGDTGDITLSSVGTGSNLQVGGISGSSLNITGNSKIDGNLTLGGQLTIGDATSDTVNVVASLSSSLIPSVTNAFDLGSENYFWRDLYISTGSIKFVGAAGTVVGTLTNAGNGLALDAGVVANGNSSFGTSSLAVTSVTGSLRVSGNVVVTDGGITGSIAATNGVVSGSSQVIGILTSLNTFSGSQLTQNTSLATITGSLIVTASANTTSITNLNTLTASALTRLTALEVETLNLETFSSSALTRLTALEVETANLETFSSSALTRLTALEVETANLETFSGSQLTQNTALATITGSLISSASNANGRLSAIEAVSGTFARTNSPNTFVGNQTITGSLTITQDLLVLGSSSIQNISSSTLNIGTNLITVAVDSPAVRFGGLAVIDSGSVGTSGSFLYDSIQDEFIFVHKGNGTNLTSSVFLLGPETFDNLGSETYIGQHKLIKSKGNEHTLASNITDDGSIIALGSSSVVSGSLTVTGSIIGSIAATNGVVSGSSQITAASTTGFSTAVKTQLDANTVVSGSSQINVASTTGDIALGTRTSGNYVASLVAGTNITLSNNTGEGATPTIGLTNNTISGVSLGSNLGTLTIGTGLSGTSYNGSGAVTIANTGVLSITSNTGLSSNVSATGNVTITNTGVTSNVAGTGISVSGATGAVTITNTGVTSAVAGTGISVSGATGAVTISIAQAISTSSNVQFNSLGIGMAASATAGRIDATNDIVAFSSSDIRFKENITPIENALDKISKISGNTYDWKEENKIEHGYEGNDVGVIAQEIEAVLPQLVQTRENGFKAVKYDKLVALLIQGIKEQQIQIDELKAKIGL